MDARRRYCRILYRDIAGRLLVFADLPETLLDRDVQ
jgi:hypothetical protein